MWAMMQKLRILVVSKEAKYSEKGRRGAMLRNAPRNAPRYET
jgi:hypothetical protein